jgi:hypothetical protein
LVAAAWAPTRLKVWNWLFPPGSEPEAKAKAEGNKHESGWPGNNDQSANLVANNSENQTTKE